MKKDRVCQFQNDDCNAYYAKSMCRFHYHRDYHGHDPEKAKVVRVENKGKSCAYPGCERGALSKGHCHTHHMQLWSTGEVWAIGTRPPGSGKKYGECSVENCSRQATDLARCGMHHQQFWKGVLEPIPEDEQCRVLGCKAQSSLKNILCHAHNKKKRQYGLSVNEIIRLFERGVCHICGIEDPRLHIDHDHSCCPGKTSCGQCVRGLLCYPCNVGLGFFKDNAESLASAITYLSAKGVG